MNTPPQQQSTATAPAPVACINCRDKHLKCDGDPAGCSRCTASNLACYYLPSRRGRKCNPSTSHAVFNFSDLFALPASMDLSLQLEPMDMSLIDGNWRSSSDFPALSPDLTGLSSQMHGSHPSETPLYLSSQQHPHPALNYGENYLAGLYYSHFHPSHPFLLPQEALFASDPPRYLIDVMNLISLHYVARDLITFDRISQLKTLTRQTVLSVEKAQALLLLSIVLHAHVLPEAAQECLGQAIKCGQQLGLDHGNAFVAERVQDPLHAESLRRTWWELFVIDTLLAAVQTDGVLQITSQELSNVPLPCEEGDYHCGGGHHDVALITARDLEQSRHLFFSEERGISSLGYRIEAAILFRKSLLLATTHETTDALDAAIASWFHRLPNNKSAILNCNGELDQMMFQAVMMMHCASIYLHFPRSCLPALLPVTGHLFCSSPPRFLTAAAIPQRHTGKVLTAALDISKLASLSTSAINHSPFFCCTLMLSSIVQLAIRCAKLQEPCSANLEFLGINLSVLKSMGEIWKIAEASKLRLREVIMEIGSVIPVNP